MDISAQLGGIKLCILRRHSAQTYKASHSCEKLLSMIERNKNKTILNDAEYIATIT